MNVCLITANFPPMPWPCGLADFVDRLATNLRAAGTEVSVLTSNPAADAKKPYPVQVMPGSWRYWHQKQMAGWIRDRKFDVIDFQYETFAFGQKSRPFWFPLRLKSPRPARVLTLHSQGLPKWGGRVWRLLQTRPWEAVVFYSEPFLNRMKALFPTRADRFYHLGFPSNIPVAVAPALRQLIARVKAGWANPDAVVLYFGHIAANRGIEDLLAAATNLAGRGLRPQFVFASKFDPTADDYHRQLLGRVAAAGLSDRVSFPGQLPAEQVSHLFQAADVVALPFPEGASFKNGTLATALGHGAAVVTTVTDLTESALKADGVLAAYAPGDVAALTDRLAELLTSPEQRRTLSVGASRLGELFSWDAYIQRRLEIYQKARENRV